MRTSLFIAGRYLFSKKKRNAINIISSVAVLAFAVCTSALIVILSTMNGFESLIFSMYNKFNPEIKVSLNEGKVFEQDHTIQKLKSIKGIKNMMPIMEDNAAIRNGDYQTVCTVKGVDSNYFIVNGLHSMVVEGEGIVKQNAYNFMVLGSGIDQKINCNIGGPFSLVSLITPRRGDFNVNDIESIKSMEIEPAGVLTLDETISNRYVFVPIDFAQSLFERENQISSLEITLQKNTNVDVVLNEVKQVLGKSFKVQNRMEQQASLYKMFKSEKWASYAILTFILLIAAFNALGSLTMLVIEKKDDIKTLMGMGARPSLIRNVFFSNGFFISAIGTFFGLALGIALVLVQEKYGLVKMQGAIVENYPVKLLLKDVLLVLGTALGLGVLTGIYPALKAMKS
jgi:ABC-type lipoprotein release transport system permease subunit